jgi:hypothetical protein
MRVKMRVSSPEPAVRVSTPAGTRPGRLRRHGVIGYADPGQNLSARQVRQQSDSGGVWAAPARSPADRRPDERQGATVPGLVRHREPRWEPPGRTTFRESGRT